ncbi:hypothetical protein ABKN59_011789, partial [Abortiporus biennis]
MRSVASLETHPDWPQGLDKRRLSFSTFKTVTSRCIPDYQIASISHQSTRSSTQTFFYNGRNYSTFES